MNISEEQRAAIKRVLEAGDKFGFGNMIAHLQTAWAKRLMDKHGLDEEMARRHAGGDGYPFAMQDEMVTHGTWDETGKRYAKQGAK